VAVFILLAAVCRTRARFIALAPLVTLVLGALSGSLIPSMLLPRSMNAVGEYLFPAWGIAAIRSAIEGHGNLPACAALLALAVTATIVSRHLERRVSQP
jgi:hypothetical protein